jgi:hypothetical protein
VLVGVTLSLVTSFEGRSLFLVRKDVNACLLGSAVPLMFAASRILEFAHHILK